MKRNSLIFFTAICGLLLSSACKPTEKNYKAAYDKAQEKARQGLATEEYEQMLLNSLPSYERTATDSVRTFVEGVVSQYTPTDWLPTGGAPQCFAMENLNILWW